LVSNETSRALTNVSFILSIKTLSKIILSRVKTTKLRKLPLLKLKVSGYGLYENHLSISHNKDFLYFITLQLFTFYTIQFKFYAFTTSKEGPICYQKNSAQIFIFKQE
jgi:hypothetical protein